MKDYRVVAKVKNNRIISRIEALGFASVYAFCKAHPHVHYSNVCEIISMKTSPLGRRGEWLKVAMDLATALRVQPEELFNERQKLGGVESTFTREVDDTTISLEHTKIADRLLPPPDAAITARVDAEHLMQCLSPRQRLVLEMMYGLDGQPEATLDEVAHAIGVGRERVRQIAAGAMRKMRHPANGGGAYVH